MNVKRKKIKENRKKSKIAQDNKWRSIQTNKYKNENFLIKKDGWKKNCINKCICMNKLIDQIIQ